MGGTATGALATAARRIGVTVEDYAQHVAVDEKWCIGCKAWHPIEHFGPDRSRRDGRGAACRESKNRRARALYAQRDQPEAGG